MKKTTYLFIVASMFTFACSNQVTSPEKDLKIENAKPISNQDVNVFEFSRRNGWDYLGKNKNDVSWQEADKLYKKIVSKKENQLSNFFDMFRQIAIQTIVVKYELSKSNDVNVIRFYLDELMNCEGQNPKVGHILLERLKTELGETKTKEYAKKMIDNNQYELHTNGKEKSSKAVNEIAEYSQKLKTF